MNTDIQISTSSAIPFHNRAFFCIGSGRMGLALTQEYQEELAYVQRRLHFSHIRAHGLFCDDLAICRRVEGELRFNFTYLDLVMDFYRSLGLRPFLELGFMPEALASGTQTVFVWKGNVTPPREQEEWARLVQATLRHLMERYGAQEVVQWPIEVWNEPNLSISGAARTRMPILRSSVRPSRRSRRWTAVFRSAARRCAAAMTRSGSATFCNTARIRAWPLTPSPATTTPLSAP